MENFDIGSLLLVGALVSVVVQVIKQVFGTSKVWSMLAVIVLSLVGGAVYVAIKDAAYFPVVLSVLANASMVYAFIMKNFETK